MINYYEKDKSATYTQFILPGDYCAGQLGYLAVSMTIHRLKLSLIQQISTADTYYHEAISVTI